MMSSDPSVEPPSTMMYSRFGYSCWITLSMVWRSVSAPFRVGVTTVILGRLSGCSDMILDSSEDAMGAPHTGHSQSQPSLTFDALAA